MGKPFKKLLKNVLHTVVPFSSPDVRKKAPSIIGSAVGSYFGGPAGAIIGGSIGGSMERGSGNKMAGMFNGAKVGSIYASLAPMGAEFMGASPSSTGFLSSVTGLNQPSLLNQLGMSSAPGIGGGLGLFGNAGTQGFLQGNGLLGGMLDKAPSFFSKGRGDSAPSVDYGSHYSDSPYSTHGTGLSRRGNSNHLYDYQNLDRADSYSMPHHDVAAGALLNKLSSDNKKKKSLHEEFMADLIRAPHHNQHPLKRRFDDVPVERRYAKGGFVNPNATGYIKEGNTGGQDDDVDMMIPNGSYVMNATDLSLYGDGSSENGAKKFAELEHKVNSKRKVSNFDRGGYAKPYDEHQYGLTQPKLKVKVSNDEYVLTPETVTAIGKGSNERGSKVIDKWRMNLRKQKGVQKILPPKSKNFNYYLKGTKHAVN